MTESEVLFHVGQSGIEIIDQWKEKFNYKNRAVSIMCILETAKLLMESIDDGDQVFVHYDEGKSIICIQKLSNPWKKPKFVRGQDQIAIDSEAATGLRIGFNFLESVMNSKSFKEMYDEILDKGSCIIPNCERDLEEAFLTSGLTIEELSNESGISIEIIQDMMNRKKRSSIHEISKVCKVFNIDVRTFGFPKEWLKNGEML